MIEITEKMAAFQCMIGEMSTLTVSLNTELKERGWSISEFARRAVARRRSPGRHKEKPPPGVAGACGLVLPSLSDSSRLVALPKLKIVPGPWRTVVEPFPDALPVGGILAAAGPMCVCDFVGRKTRINDALFVIHRCLLPRSWRGVCCYSLKSGCQGVLHSGHSNAPIIPLAVTHSLQTSHQRSETV